MKPGLRLFKSHWSLKSIILMHGSTCFLSYFISLLIKNILKSSKTLEWLNVKWGRLLLRICTAAVAELFCFSPLPGFSLSSCFCLLCLSLLSRPHPWPVTKLGAGASLKHKAGLVTNLRKSGLIAKFNSKDSFWRLSIKRGSSRGLTVSRTPCPYYTREGRGRLDLLLLATMFGRFDTY